MPKKFKQIDLCKRDEKLFVRLPALLKKEISKSADKSSRSLAAEVALRLLQSLEDYEFIPSMPD